MYIHLGIRLCACTVASLENLPRAAAELPCMASGLESAAEACFHTLGWYRKPEAGSSSGSSRLLSGEPSLHVDPEQPIISASLELCSAPGFG